ncbi:MAG TPA: hypothetical protein VMW87_04335 [Spirochaetia bacterium]|nr:hypothetical protein [Spirochaetia bacterium]
MHQKSYSSNRVTKFAVAFFLGFGLVSMPLFAQSNTSAGSQAQSAMTAAPAQAKNSSGSTTSKLTQAQELNRERLAARALVLAHWTQVANRDVQNLATEYANHAVIAWVGGPLNGTYQGLSAINGLWSKFAGATAPMQFQVTSVSYDLSKTYPTVREDVKLMAGKKAIHVDSTLVYDKDKIMAEIWKVNS